MVLRGVPDQTASHEEEITKQNRTENIIHFIAVHQVYNAKHWT